jgi:hypothetical protein
LYEVTRYTIIIACLSGMFSALVAFELLVLVAFAIILYLVERVGTGPEIVNGLSSYHWFVLYLCLANTAMALSLSPNRDIYDVLPQPVSNTLKYARYEVLRTPPVSLFRGMMGRASDNTREIKNLYEDLKAAGWNMDETVARKPKRTEFGTDFDENLPQAEDTFCKGKKCMGKGKKGKAVGKGKSVEAPKATATTKAPQQSSTKQPPIKGKGKVGAKAAKGAVAVSNKCLDSKGKPLANCHEAANRSEGLLSFFLKKMAL